MAVRRIGPFGGVTAIAALLAGAPASGWEAPGGGSLVPNATLTIVQEAGDPITVAPHFQWFTVGSLSGFTPPGPVSSGEVIDPSAHDITYIWDFGDPGSVPHPSSNLPTAWRDTNRAYGKRVCHVYAGHGTFTITVHAFDADGNYGVATTTITVADPATFFPGNRTICVNPVGDTDFSQAIPGAQQVVGLANVAAAALVPGATSRIMLKRGADFTGEQFSSWSGAHPNVYVTGLGYGTGADPRIVPPAADEIAIVNYHSVPGVACNKFVGLFFDGLWDVVSETGWSASLINIIGQTSPLLVHACRMRGFNGNIWGKAPTADVIVSACFFENWRAFALLPTGAGGGPNDRLAVIGTGMHMSPDAGQGLRNSFFEHKLGNFNGPVRIGYMRNLFFSCVSLFSNTGWSPDGGGPPGQVSRQSVQSSLRGGSDPVDYYNPSLPTLWNLDRCYFEGNGVDLMNTELAYPGNYVVDKCMFVGMSDMNRGHLYMTGGTTVRNSLFYSPDTRQSKGVALGFTFNGVNVARVPEARDRRVRVYNCTFYGAATSANRVWYNPANLASRGNIGLFEAPAGWVPFTNAVFENNVVHCPAQDAPLTAAAPLSLVAIPGVQTLYRGLRWSFPVVPFTVGAPVPNGGSITVPYPDDSLTATSDDRKHVNGRVTDQAYFLASPGSGRHMLGFSGDGLPKDLKAFGSSPQFSVNFEPTVIRITNLSGSTWQTGWVGAIHFDRMASNGSRQTVGFTSPPDIALPRPLTGSPVIGVLTGLTAWDDFFGTVRAGEPVPPGFTGQPGTAPDGGAVAA